MQVCLSNPESKGKYIKIILALLQSPSSAVVYECAVTLTKLSQAPTAVRAAANCYCQVNGALTADGGVCHLLHELI
jgi:coatomer subunit beta